jgi:peptidoglycan-associated lipoprotein
MNRFFKLLPVLFICFALISCKGATVKKDVTAATAAEKPGIEETVVQDDETLLEEDIRTTVAAGDQVPKVALLPSSPKDLDEKAAEAGKLYMVHFDFDKYVIKDEYKGRLRENAKWLKKNSVVNLVIEGHADERGENEYNLALGDKRATSVKRYLKALGVNTSRLSTISYGEEKPLDEAGTEAAWAKNRRAEFHIAN